MAAGLSRSIKIVPVNAGIRDRISRLRSGSSAIRQIGWFERFGWDVHPERDDGEFRIAAGMHANVHGNQAIPDRLVPLSGTKAPVAADHDEAAPAFGDQLDSPLELFMCERSSARYRCR